MKRRYLLATAVSSLLVGCQSLRGGKTNQKEEKTSTVELAVTNESAKKDVLDLSVVMEGTLVYWGEVTVSPGERKRIPESWNGRTFGIFGLSQTHSTYEVQAIDEETYNLTYRINFVIEDSGGVVTRGFGPDN